MTSLARSGEMSKLEYGCFVHNQFEEIPAEVGDPFELLNAKLKEQASLKEKRKNEPKDVSRKGAHQGSGIEAGEGKKKKEEPVPAAESPKKSVTPKIPAEVMADDGGDQWTSVDDLQQRPQVVPQEVEVRDSGRGSFVRGRGGRPPFRGGRQGFDSGRGEGSFEGRRGRRPEEVDRPAHSDQADGGEAGFVSRTFRRGGRGGRFDGEGQTASRPRGGRARGGRGFGRGGGAPQTTFDDYGEDIGGDSLPSAIDYAGEGGEARPSTFRQRLEQGRESGKRQFDRHSGKVGFRVRADDKRQGAGAHNWGSVLQTGETEFASATSEGGAQQHPQQPSVSPRGELDASDEMVPVEDAIQEEAAEEEHPQMTLDEYREQQRRNRAVAADSKAARQAGEGEDPKRWGKHTHAYRKKPDEMTKYNQQVSAEQSDDDQEGSVGGRVESRADELRQNLFVGRSSTDRHEQTQFRGGRRGPRVNRGQGTMRRDYRDDRAGDFERRSDYNEGGRGLGRRGRSGGFYSSAGRGREPRDVDFNRPRDERAERQSSAKPPDMSDFPELS